MGEDPCLAAAVASSWELEVIAMEAAAFSRSRRTTGSAAPAPGSASAGGVAFVPGWATLGILGAPDAGGVASWEGGWVADGVAAASDPDAPGFGTFGEI